MYFKRSLVPILKPLSRRLVKLFETVTLRSKRMERQTTPPSLARRHSTNSSILKRNLKLSARHITNGRCRGLGHKHIRNAEEANFKAKFFFRPPKHRYLE